MEKDEKKQRHHLEVAAIGGHPEARHNLVLLEFKHGRYDKVMKHEIIAANLGDDYALERVGEGSLFHGRY